MRKCHLNTCPVGIATQDPELRKRFVGKPEHIINYFFFVAEEVRELMAQMGYRTFNEMIGQMQMLDKSRAVKQTKAEGLDFSKLFKKPDVGPEVSLYQNEEQSHQIHDIMDRKLIKRASSALESGKKVVIELPVHNTDRTVGTMLSSEIARKYGDDGLEPDTIRVRLTGTAGQSFGAFVARGVTLELTGEANDYVGKGLSGGRLIVKPDPSSKIVPELSMIVGNTVLYGATSGECYFRGIAGERFAVRNSGAIAVVEGVGDHGCEYMTGGVAVILGPTGRNFAAGMSGGVAYVLDEDGDFARRCNLSMVELEPIPAEDDLHERLHHQGGDLENHGRVDILQSMTKFDAERIYTLVSNHEKYTGSERAKAILADWDDILPKFVKVMPVDYARALQDMEAAEAASPELVAGE